VVIADREVDHAPLGLGPLVAIRGNVDTTHRPGCIDADRQVEKLRHGLACTHSLPGYHGAT